MNNFLLWGFVVMTTILCIAVSSATDVSSCSTISSSGNYMLNQSISGSINCMNISASNVLFDCNGSTILYDLSGTNGGMGVFSMAPTGSVYTNVTVQNCIISKPASNGTTSYGIHFYSINSTLISNNSIFTNGTNDNYGIYLRANITGATIIQNNISARGSTTNNWGIHAATGINNSYIANNTINSTGTATNYGIYLLGVTATPVFNTTVVNNNIMTLGSGASNYGIFLSTNGNLNVIYNNTVYANGLSSDYGIHLLGATTSSINNTEIAYNSVLTNGTAAATTNDYGIFLSTGVYHSNITLNNISSSGPTRNFGIHLTGTTAVPVSNNSITYNFISTSGSGASNWGIHLTTNANNNTIIGNTIFTSGTTTNYGIHFLGVTTSTVNNNTVLYNIINTTGSGASNYGIYLSTNTSINNIIRNNVTVNGTTTNHAIYILGATGANSDRNNITSNIVNVYGSSATAGSAGLLVQTNARNNTLNNNNITLYGVTSNWGISLSGTAALHSEDNIIDSNYITLYTNATANFGIYLLTAASYNIVSNNTIVTNGTTTNYGIHLLGTTAPVRYNKIYGNNISTGKASTANNGIYLLNSADNNEIFNNLINVTGTATAYGISLSAASNNYLLNNTISQVFGTALTNEGILLTSASKVNTVENNIINNVVGDSIALSFSTYSPDNNIIKNNTFGFKNLSDFRVLNSDVNGLQVINQLAGTYNFTAPGSDGIIIENTQYGKIAFLDRITGSSFNFTRDVQISQDYIFINVSSNSGLNTPATVSFYNITEITAPIAMKDGVVCPSNVCTNMSTIVNGTISLDVINWSNYTIAQANSPIVNATSPANNATVYAFQNVTFNFTSTDQQVTSTNCSLYINSTRYDMNISSLNASVTQFSVSNLTSSVYYWNVSCTNSYGASNTSQTMALNVISTSNISVNGPSNNSYIEGSNVTLNVSVSGSNMGDNITVYFYVDDQFVNSSQFSVQGASPVVVNISKNFSIAAHNWSAISSSGTSNFSTGVYTFSLVNVSLLCEAGGPYQQNALAIVYGNISNGFGPVVNQSINLTIFRAGAVNISRNLTTNSGGDFQSTFSNLVEGNYTTNISVTYQGFNYTCSDDLSITSGLTPAALSLDKIVSLNQINDTHVSYNVTLRVVNRGGSRGNNLRLVDTNSVSSPYALNNLTAGEISNNSYVLSYARNSTVYNVTLVSSRVNGTDSYLGGEVSANSSQTTLIIPSSTTNASLSVIKNAQYNSENSTAVNYTLSIEVVNSGGVDLTSISVIDSDLSLTNTTQLNRTQSYTYSGSIIISKAASNEEEEFVAATATANGTTYESNEISVLIPGYGGPADAIVFAPASVNSSEDFSSIIQVSNMNPDIGQDFTIDYWITNESESQNYSSGQKTVYVSASGETNTTVVLAAPESDGEYRLRSLVSWVGGTAKAYDSFTVVTANDSESDGSEESSGGGGGSSSDDETDNTITGEVVQDSPEINETIVPECYAPYIHYFDSCCLDVNNDTICDNDQSSGGTRERSKYSVVNAAAGFISGIKRLFNLGISPENDSSDNFFGTLLVGVFFTGFAFAVGFVAVFLHNRWVISRLNVNPRTLTRTIGMSVYSTNGIKIGKIRDVHLEDISPRVYCWMIQLESAHSHKLKKKEILLKQKYVVSIKDVMLVDSGVEDYISQTN